MGSAQGSDPVHEGTNLMMVHLVGGTRKYKHLCALVFTVRPGSMAILPKHLQRADFARGIAHGLPVAATFDIPAFVHRLDPGPSEDETAWRQYLEAKAQDRSQQYQPKETLAKDDMDMGTSEAPSPLDGGAPPGGAM